MLANNTEIEKRLWEAHELEERIAENMCQLLNGD
jgi:hypothetical protein